MTKKLYNQPEILVSGIETMSVICASGPTDGSGQLNNIPTDYQW